MHLTAIMILKKSESTTVYGFCYAMLIFLLLQLARSRISRITIDDDKSMVNK